MFFLLVIFRISRVIMVIKVVCLFYVFIFLVYFYFFIVIGVGNFWWRVLYVISSCFILFNGISDCIRNGMFFR